MAIFLRVINTCFFCTCPIIEIYHNTSSSEDSYDSCAHFLMDNAYGNIENNLKKRKFVGNKLVNVCQYCYYNNRSQGKIALHFTKERELKGIKPPRSHSLNHFEIHILNRTLQSLTKN
jgi:hypothetical protein